MLHTKLQYHDAEDFYSAMVDAGIDFVSGVPCSLLTPLINKFVIHDRMNHVGATSEGEAVGIATGAWLAGRVPCVYLQNSGLGNVVNPIASLSHPFKVPMLMLVTWRGEPGVADEPQHLTMGKITLPLLDLLSIKKKILTDERAGLADELSSSVKEALQTDSTYAIVVRGGAIVGTSSDNPLLRGVVERAHGRDCCSGLVAASRYEALETISACAPKTAGIITTTGKTGRELFTIEDREQHLYLVGSMGLASAVGAGVALNSRRKIIVIDGDGAALMKLGNIATIGAYQPQTLIHVILDNGVHDSTGGQPTSAHSFDFANAAIAAGFRSAVSCDDLETLHAEIERSIKCPGPHLIHMRIKPGSITNLGRPTIAPFEVARRFRSFVASSS